ncbi:folate-binding protein [Actinomycetaceae bacterium TAE3-ERU4]|nr:folate-binding protein [Actinomycetaceae bacterium TAE3-ERU4]
MEQPAKNSRYSFLKNKKETVFSDTESVFNAQSRVQASVGIPLHYGNPLGEQERLAKNQAVAVLPYGIVRLSGPERAQWISSLASQKLDNLQLEDETWRHALILDPQGHIRYDFWAKTTSEELYLITPDAEGLTNFLRTMKFRTQVEIENITEDYLVMGDCALTGEANLGEIFDLPGLVLTGKDTWPELLTGGTTYTGEMPQNNHPGTQIQTRLTIVERDKAEVTLLKLGSGYVGTTSASEPIGKENNWRYLAGFLAWEALRIAAWQPSYSEVDGKTMPHELDWLRDSVHLKKGCYCGQETVARIINLGKPPRRLAFLHLDGSGEELPKCGTEIKSGEEKVGVITSIAEHYEDGPIALALLKRSLSPQAQLVAGNVAAAQTVIVIPEGKSAASPKQRPGAELLKGGVRRPPGSARL